MSINNSKLRNGNFTSSQMSRLINYDTRPMTAKEKEEHKKQFPSSKKRTTRGDGFLQKGLTYIEEVSIERRIGRSVNTEVKTQSMKWGKVMEIVLFDLLGLEYSMQHKDTLVHPKYSFWSGTPDLMVPDVKTGEIKCFEPKHFGQLSLALLTQDTEKVKEKEPEAYWQAVSNSIIAGLPKAEIIAYMPYRSELLEIMKKIDQTNFLEKNGLNDYDYFFMQADNIENLAYLPDDCDFSNINTFEFELPKHDVEELTERVVRANEISKEICRQYTT